MHYVTPPPRRIWNILLRNLFLYLAFQKYKIYANLQTIQLINCIYYKNKYTVQSSLIIKMCNHKNEHTPPLRCNRSKIFQMCQSYKLNEFNQNCFKILVFKSSVELEYRSSLWILFDRFIGTVYFGGFKAHYWLKIRINYGLAYCWLIIFYDVCVFILLLTGRFSANI